jgi:hypothetical protein
MSPKPKKTGPLPPPEKKVLKDVKVFLTEQKSEGTKKKRV